MLDVGALFYTFDPSHGRWVCDLRAWFTAFSLVVILGNLIVKAFRIKRVFGDMNLRVKRLTNSALLFIVGVMVTVEIVLLMAFSIANISGPETVEGQGSDDTSVTVLYQCNTSGNSYWAWFIIQITYVGLFMVWGAYVAFGTKDTPSAFNESTHILGALLELIFLSIVLIPLDFINQDSPQATLLIRGLGQSFGCLTLAMILFGPKLYYIAVGRGNDKAMVDTASFVVSHSSTMEKQSSGMMESRAPQMQMTPSRGGDGHSSVGLPPPMSRGVSSQSQSEMNPDIESPRNANETSTLEN